MNELVGSPLQKGAVNRHVRPQASGGHAGSHGQGMLFRDSHVKKPVGKGPAEGGQACSLGHGGRHGYHVFILPGQFNQDFTRQMGECPGLLPLGHLSIIGIKRRHAVEIFRLVLSVAVTLPLDRHHMEQYRAAHQAQGAEMPLQFSHVVSVNRPIVTESHLFKDDTGLPPP